MGIHQIGIFQRHSMKKNYIVYKSKFKWKKFSFLGVTYKYLLAVCHLLSRKLLELGQICLKNAWRRFHTKSTDKKKQSHQTEIKFFLLGVGHLCISMKQSELQQIGCNTTERNSVEIQDHAVGSNYTKASSCTNYCHVTRKP